MVGDGVTGLHCNWTLYNPIYPFPAILISKLILNKVLTGTFSIKPSILEP